MKRMMNGAWRGAAAAAVVMTGGVGVASGDVRIDDFTKFINHGGWAFLGPSGFAFEGGNPGAYLRSEGNDTFLVRLESSGASDFTGDYAARRVRRFGVDVIVEHTDFPSGGRQLALILLNDAGTPGDSFDDYGAFVLSEGFVPEQGDGWVSFSFEVPGPGEGLPAGWQLFALDGEPPIGLVWNDVLSDVDSVMISLGDPTLFYIFQNWTAGVDNIVIEWGCRADWDGNGIVNAADVGSFLTTYFEDLTNGTTVADFDGNGITNSADVGAFLTAYFTDLSEGGVCP